MNKLRTKNNVYRRKKAEIEQQKAETQIMERTLELLRERLEQVTKENVNFINYLKSECNIFRKKSRNSNFFKIRKMFEKLFENINYELQMHNISRTIFFQKILIIIFS